MFASFRTLEIMEWFDLRRRLENIKSSGAEVYNYFSKKKRKETKRGSWSNETGQRILLEAAKLAGRVMLSKLGRLVHSGPFLMFD